MPETITEQIETMEIPLQGDALVEVLHARDRLDAKLTEALMGYLATGGHDADGWPSATGWLRARAGVTRKEANRLVARTRRLRQWPALAQAWFDGRLTGAQLDVVEGTIPRHLVDLFADHDAELTPFLLGLTTDDTRVAVRDWVGRARALVEHADPCADAGGPHREVRLSRTFQDRLVGELDLDPDLAALTEAALRVAERPDPEGVVRTVHERRAESWSRICRFYLDHATALGSRPGRQHPHLMALIEIADLYANCLRGHGIRTDADLERFVALRPTSVVEEGFMRDALRHASGRLATVDGHALSPGIVTEVFGAGSLIERLVLADGRVLDHGRQVRLAPTSLRDAVLVRDLGCRFPGCHAGAAWVDAHHVEHWEQGGSTSIDNLVGLCGSHHGVVHRHGWQAWCDPDGTFRVRGPDGAERASPPPRRPDRRRPSLPLRPAGATPLAPEVHPALSPELEPDPDEPSVLGQVVAIRRRAFALARANPAA